MNMRNQFDDVRMRDKTTANYIRELIFELSTLPEDDPRYAQIERELRQFHHGMPGWLFRILLFGRKVVSFIGIALSILLFTLGLDEWGRRMAEKIMKSKEGRD